MHASPDRRRGARPAWVDRRPTRYALRRAQRGPDRQRAVYHPQSAAISSAYVSTFDEYVRDTLKFGQGMPYRAVIYHVKDFHWDMKHRGPGRHFGNGAGLGVMGDLAAAMKYNPEHGRWKPAGRNPPARIVASRFPPYQAAGSRPGRTLNGRPRRPSRLHAFRAVPAPRARPRRGYRHGRRSAADRSARR